MIEVETPQEIEVVTNGVEVEASTLDVEVVDLSELDITVAKREFVITGDDIYVPKLYDDAPQWMKDLVDIVVNNAMETGNAATLNEMTSMLSQFAVSYVPLNQYTQSILDLSNEDARINSVIETLNSNFNDGLSEANAQIINVQNTKASKDEVIAQVITTLSAQLANPTSELGATIGRIDQTIVNNQSANALSMQVLTSTLEGLGEDVSGNSTALQALSTYVGVEEGVPTGTGLLADVAILQKQNDGVIETYTGTYDVMIGIEDPNNNTDNDQLDATKEPYASWLAEDVANSDIAARAAHVGDVYIKYSNSAGGYKSYERAYKFIKTVVDGTSPYATDSAGFTWALIVDTDAQNAYVAALNAYDLADDKRRVFVGLGATSTPSVPYDRGDLWLIDAERTVNGYACKVGDLLRCLEPKGKFAIYEENDWVLASSYANAVAAEAAALETWKNTTYASTIATIQTQVDGKAETFYQSSIPTGRIKSINVPTNSTLDKYVGDLWKNTYAGTTGGYLGDNTEYIYTKTANGSNWNYDWTKMEVPDIVFDTIDTKKSIYSGNSLPVAVYPDVIELNDMWITGDTPVAPYVAKSIYVWSKTGSNPDTFGWAIPVRYTDDTELNAFVNTVYTPAIAGLQTQVDGQVSYYFYDSALGQTAASVSGSASWTTDTLKRDHNGDIAYDTTLKVGYWYDRITASWVQITGTQNAGVIEALKRAAAAKEAADSVIVSYYAWKQTTAPATQYKWMKDDNTLWEYVGSSWVAVDVKKDDTLTAYDNTTKDTTLYVHNGSNWAMITPNGLVANAKAVTDLNASLTSMGTTVSGHTSLLNTVDARIGTEGARVESKFGYDSSLVLNGTTYNSGFGIATSLTTGSGLPTGQSEFWIKADKFKLMSADGSRKSSYSPFTVDSVTGEINFNGKVSFSSVTGASSSANMLYNSAPAIGLETKGWHADYNDTGLTSSGLLATPDPYRPTGYGSFHQYINGTPAAGKVFDIRTDGKIPVIGGQYYEASAYLNTYRCNGQIYIGWMDAAGAAITWSTGSIILQTNTQGNLTNWRRSTLIAQAPANATSCYFYIRGISTGEATPHVFVSMCYFGRASDGQTVISNWSEGISAGVSSNEVVSAINSGQTTTIDGGKITTGSVTASQINTVGLIAENINAVEIVGKTITGGTIIGASITGVTIKASYLDLDGELEVLTNFYLCVNGNTTGVPAEAIAEGRYRTYNSSLDIDAIPSTTYANIYRIPTLSTVRETVKNINISTVTTESGVLYSYNTANVLTNLKSVKRSPVFTNSSSFEIFKAIAYNDHFGTVNYILSNKFRLKLGNIVLFECTLEWESAAGQWDGNLMYAKATYSGEFFTTINHLSNAYYGYYNYSANNTVNIGIGTLEVNVQCNRGALEYNAPIEVTAVLNAGSTQFPGNWDFGSLTLETITLYQGTSPNIYPNVVTSNVNFKLLSSLAINNMV